MGKGLGREGRRWARGEQASCVALVVSPDEVPAEVLAKEREVEMGKVRSGGEGGCGWKGTCGQGEEC